MRFGLRQGQESRYAPGSPQRMAQDPDHQRPPGASYFKVEGVATGLTMASLETTLDFDEIPVGNVGVVGSFYINLQNTVSTTNARFRLKENGGVKQGWDPLIAPQVAAAVNQGYDGDFVRIPFVDGARVELTVQIFDAGGPYAAYAQAVGYFYSKEIRAAWLEEG